MFHYTLTSKRNMDQTIQSLKECLSEEKFGVLWEFDIKEKLQSKDIDFDKDYIVLEVCNPQEASRVLKKNQLVGYFLPCKIVVFDDKGKIKVGLPKPSVMIDLVEDEELKEIAIDIEKRLISAIDKSIK
ncbi:DUF302 domain-containing protein [Gracilibacillus kekensis]|uniref:Uncharacterized conserved protein, DUF302 family n=1 Tax=Gracilibacillus kekensis TaxID=1027249 RepID=A0A1M7QWJ3_9BACI|nr:DUF302 domain-containing protein [Gracilibacillus kekensis]SHN36031.1 Uncharacterized conserved protein, DUF302 family [Gracilibacillus kekensis]